MSCETTTISMQSIHYVSSPGNLPFQDHLLVIFLLTRQHNSAILSLPRMPVISTPSPEYISTDSKTSVMVDHNRDCAIYPPLSLSSGSPLPEYNSCRLEDPSHRRPTQQLCSLSPSVIVEWAAISRPSPRYNTMK